MSPFPHCPAGPSARAAAILAGALVASASLAAPLVAQSAPISPARRAVYDAYLDFDQLVQGGRVVPGWIPGGTSLWYAGGGPNDRVLQRVELATGRTTPLLDAERLRRALVERLGHEPAGRGVPFAQVVFTAPQQLRFELEGDNWQLDLVTYALTRLPRPTANEGDRLATSELTRQRPQPFWQESFTGGGETRNLERRSPDGRWYLGVQGHDIALRSATDGRTLMRTTDGTADSLWTVETRRWEPWSPSGTRFVAQRHDVRGMQKMLGAQWLKMFVEPLETRWTRAGGVLQASSLYVLDVVWGRPVALNLGDTRDSYLQVMGWLPDESRVLVAKYDRLLHSVEVWAADPSTGEGRVIMSERSPTFLTNHHEVVWGDDFPWTMLPDGTGFLWRSERDGWDHLYRYDLNGRMVARLTQGSFPVTSVVRVDQQRGWVYFMAQGDPARPYDRHLYRVPLAGGGTAQRLSEGAGVHEVTMCPLADCFVDSWSSPAGPPHTVLRRSDGAQVTALGEASIDRLRRVGWTPPREYVVKAADGSTDLWVTMYLPFDFDSTRSYPVVEFLYAGPQVAVRPTTFAEPGPAQYNRALANLGFVVVTLDARGTPGRSKAFHDVVFRKWGTFEIADHAGAIRQLGARLPFMDLTRVGIWGRSWGGHYALRALAQAPDVYSAASVEVPGFDPVGNQLYETYLGLPQQNAALYDQANAILLAPKVRGHLRLMSALSDVATFPETMRMSEELVRLGFQHELSIFANSGHGQVGQTARYNDEQRTQFFVRHLRP
ncbi:DPP IV N-terminal domain-containing protein [Gemmatimonas sp.]|uniref:S9 family peptidase n=1 Tax=Gemmatimonas sp. TaxID=1962908 RepID=UPI00391CADD7